MEEERFRDVGLFRYSLIRPMLDPACSNVERGAMVRAVAPKPLNVVMFRPGLGVAALADLGVRRISVGGSLARAAMNAFIRTATEIAKEGKFDGFAGLVSNAELNKFFSEDRKNHS